MNTSVTMLALDAKFSTVRQFWKITMKRGLLTLNSPGRQKAVKSKGLKTAAKTTCMKATSMNKIIHYNFSGRWYVA